MMETIIENKNKLGRKEMRRSHTPPVRPAPLHNLSAPPPAMHALVKLTLGTGYVGQGSDHIL